MRKGAGATLIIFAKMWRSMSSRALSVSNRLFSAYDGHRMNHLGELTYCRIEIGDVSIVSNKSNKQYGLLGRDVLETSQVRPFYH